MPLLTVPLDLFLFTTLAMCTSWYYFFGRKHNTLSYRGFLNVFLLLHSIYILGTIIMLAPPNLFRALNLPVTTTAEVIRATVRSRAGLDPNVLLPPSLDNLIMRLSSFDMRVLYIRFGHDAVQSCDYCSSFGDLAIFTLPKICLQYLRTTVVIGIITSSSTGRKKWRRFGIGALLAGIVTEAWCTASTTLHIPKDGLGVTMWHDLLWLGRHLLFLVNPIIMHLLPPQPPTPTLANISPLPNSETTLVLLSLLRWVVPALQTNPTLRAASDEYWARERRAGESLREDDAVKHMAQRAGLGYEETGGKDSGAVNNNGGENLRTRARSVADSLKMAVGPTLAPQFDDIA